MIIILCLASLWSFRCFVELLLNHLDDVCCEERKEQRRKCVKLILNSLLFCLLLKLFLCKFMEDSRRRQICTSACNLAFGTHADAELARLGLLFKVCSIVVIRPIPRQVCQHWDHRVLVTVAGVQHASCEHTDWPIKARKTLLGQTLRLIFYNGLCVVGP